MKLGRTTPCAECPWLKKSWAGYLGADTPLHFYRASVVHEAEMPCHMEVDYEDPEWRDQLDDVDYCAGGLIYLNNWLKRPRNPVLAAATDGVGTSPHVFSEPEEYFAHHAPREDTAGLVQASFFPDPDAVPMPQPTERMING